MNSNLKRQIMRVLQQSKGAPSPEEPSQCVQTAIDDIPGIIAAAHREGRHFAEICKVHEGNRHHSNPFTFSYGIVSRFWKCPLVSRLNPAARQVFNYCRLQGLHPCLTSYRLECGGDITSCAFWYSTSILVTWNPYELGRP
ncbi:MAG: hypothetical protein KC777_02690 [Cyanobacteria bacterium HKST-UBA02]|nr:hypothetical protein [Cyanobacteria bacterium HKST-UBA02]